MKKKLEADLMSIAHRVLQMKNKSDINQLCVETQKLYEKLSILRFVEEHFGGAKPTIGQAEVVAKMKQFFEENHLSEVKPAMTKIEIITEVIVDKAPIENEIEEEEILEEEIADDETSEVTESEFNETEPDEEGEGISEDEEIVEEEPTKLEDIGFLPAFELDVEEAEEIEEPKKIEAIQISFEDFLGGDYSDTLFVKLDKNEETAKSAIDFELPKEASIQKEREDLLAEIQVSPKDIESKNVATIDKQATGISIGLNDRIAFVKHLFGNSDEDYNRVMNQLITFDSFEEAQNFIEDMVKPDYGDWQGKEEYEQRFIEIIEKKFA
jgi:hypothetical protein